jgi:protein gp37
MAQLSRIEWTDATWNPVTGCTKVSPGCKNCYAERMARRLQGMDQPRYRNGFSLTLQPDVLEEPLHWTKPKLVFVNSMSDLFHEAVPLSYIHRVFEVMERADWHIFQVLTKRHERLAATAGLLRWPENVWMGVSVESQDHVARIGGLRKVRASVRFLSVEPLLAPISFLPLKGIHWVIVGGESGPRARPMQPQWVRAVRDRCRAEGVPFFFKQWGGVHKRTAGRLLDGRAWDEMPAVGGQSGDAPARRFA